MIDAQPPDPARRDLPPPGRARRATRLAGGRLRQRAMATAGYLISRAAERPPILSLTVAIVAVRFFGLRDRSRATSTGSPRTTWRCGRSAGSASASTAAGAAGARGARGLPARRGAGPDGGGRRLTPGPYARALGPPLVALLVGGACVGLMAGLPPAGRGRPRRRTARRRPGCPRARADAGPRRRPGHPRRAAG